MGCGGSKSEDGSAAPSDVTFTVPSPEPEPAPERRRSSSRARGSSRLSSSFGGSRHASVSNPQEMQISGPMDVKHVAHMGYSANGGFDLSQLPPEWRMLFKAAGVKKRELMDPETAKYVG